MKKKKGRKNLQTATIMLAAVTTVVWLILVIVKFFAYGMDLSSLFDDVLSNILGILPPIIIFNFAYEYISKDYVADEISEEITQTLMSNPKALEAFDKDVKKEFVKSTISSLVGAEKVNAVYGAIEPYLAYQHNIRSLFEYSIDLRNYGAELDKNEVWHNFFEPNLYYRVKEKFSCKKTVAESTFEKNSFKIGFFNDITRLDNELKNQNFLFRENLNISDEALSKLSSMTDDEKKEYVQNSMKISVYINKLKTHVSKCLINEQGIVMVLTAESPIDLKSEVEIDIGFYMPQLKKNCEFLISITEPTYEPKIKLTFDENIMKVRTYPFLSEEATLLEKSTQMPGEVSICPSGWIYPVKGVMFIVEYIG